MRSEIKSLIKAWVKDSQAYIDANYCSVEEYLLDSFDENPDSVALDWFTCSEAASYDTDEMRALIVDYLHKHIHADVSAKEYLECWA